MPDGFPWAPKKVCNGFFAQDEFPRAAKKYATFFAEQVEVFVHGVSIGKLIFLLNYIQLTIFETIFEGI